MTKKQAVANAQEYLNIQPLTARFYLLANDVATELEDLMEDCKLGGWEKDIFYKMEEILKQFHVARKALCSSSGSVWAIPPASKAERTANI